MVMLFASGIPLKRREKVIIVIEGPNFLTRKVRRSTKNWSSRVLFIYSYRQLI